MNPKQRIVVGLSGGVDDGLKVADEDFKVFMNHGLIEAGRWGDF